MDEKWAKLVNIDDPIEAAIIQDILKNEGVETKSRLKDNAEYMKHITGNILSTQGIDIFVVEKDIENATEIIRIYREEIQVEEDDI
ncbi:putative signal transducing protein [Alkaliphilus peptidifermentans]|uniref:Putative signal transducing protein n=1 Tax=Alkaliphilus peptidifermentans DSM 18978 TaxID=1120976 RepID=A0A1G5L596_9FIRM|nr:DUF2007 domain-containing protein [Alkaliphilus peptidifermentans]SCZ07440.1 Putative signal transducing protein [Alkaliphilus peptidifermentans DSM 18978]